MGCAIPDTSNIRDPHAERVVCSALLKDGKAFLERLGPLSGTAFTDGVCGKLFELTAYVCYGSFSPPLLVEAWLEIKRRGGWMGEFARGRDCLGWLVSVYCVDGWFIDIERWAVHESLDSYPTWTGLAAAAKIDHLLARRQAIYAAAETIRDAIDPTGDAESLRLRADGSSTGGW